MLHLTRLTLTALIVLAAGHAEAVLLYEQLPNDSGSVNSSLLNLLGGTPGNRAATRFTLASDSTIEELEWWGSHMNSGSGLDSFTFTFFADDAGQPGPHLLTTTGTLSDPPGTLYASTLDDPFTALAATDYWVSIFNAATPAASWRWHNADGIGSALTAEPPGDAWRLDANGGQAVRLSGTVVPEPSSVSLASLGLLALGAIGRRRRR